VKTKQLLGVFGSVTLFLGVFAPIISVPVLGSMNYFQNGKGDGVVVLILAAASLVLTLTRAYRGLWVTGFLSLGMMSFTFVSFQNRLAQMHEQMDRRLGDNPFRGLAELAVGSVQLQWGWAVLVVGAIIVIAAAAMPEAAVVPQALAPRTQTGEQQTTLKTALPGPPNAPRTLLTTWLPILLGLLAIGALVAAVVMEKTDRTVSLRHSSAVGSVRIYNIALSTYSSEYGRYPSSLTDLAPHLPGDMPSATAADLVSSELAAGEKGGYVFSYVHLERAPNSDKQGYVLTARPRVYGIDGRWSLYSDQSGAIRFTEEDREAAPNDPRLY